SAGAAGCALDQWVGVLRSPAAPLASDHGRGLPASPPPRLVPSQFQAASPVALAVVATRRADAWWRPRVRTSVRSPSAVSARREVHAFATEELWIRHLF